MRSESMTTVRGTGGAGGCFVMRSLLALAAAISTFRSAWKFGPPRDTSVFHRARIVRQSSDLMKVDVEAQAEEIGFMADVSLWLGVPGLRVELPPGSFVLLNWRSPYSTSPDVIVSPQTKPYSFKLAGKASGEVQ